MHQSTKPMRLATLMLLSLSTLPQVAGQGLVNRYAVILEDPPAIERAASRSAMRSAEVSGYHAQLETKQRSLRRELQLRGIQVTGAASTLSNAIFVVAGPERVAEIKSLPGVKGVVRLRRYHKDLNRATQLINAPAAWNILGGAQNSGAGVKIGILDSGIDQTNPAFQDSSLQVPAGFPLCNGADCAFTSNKVIVARSYVRQLAAGSSPNPAADSRPDDYSPRDRDGHGTAVASCAAGEVTTAEVTFSGVAPKAYLGNYKIYGSPEVNDSTYDDVIIQALEDAFNDGMDVVSFSSGGPAFGGPLDSGAACGNDPGVPCDPVAQAFENAAKQGLIIVAAAGNEGEDGNVYPSFGTLSSPADAPSVIAAGATTNSHDFAETLSVPGSGVPASLQRISVQTGDAYVPPGSWADALVDVTQLGNDGFACTALPAGSLAGSIALVQRGPSANPCSFTTKMSNALDAGAVGVVFYMSDNSATLSPSGLSTFGLPAAMISLNDGLSLKSFLASNPDRVVAFEPDSLEQNASPNLLASFSSAGPTTGDAALKPDLLAVGTSVFMASQSYDPLGQMYSADGFAVADGTSFATPLVAGAAALIKQAHPAFSAAQIKSALINTATQDVTSDDGGNAVGIQQLGGGRLNAGAAVNAAVTSSPASISFGALSSDGLPKTVPLQIANTGTAAVSLTASLAASASGAAITLSKQNLSLAPGASDTIAVTLAGAIPSPGSYSGAVLLQGSGVTLRIPYLYLVGSGTPANLIPLTGVGFDGTVGQQIPDGFISFRLVDSFGLPVAGAPATFSARGGGDLQNADQATDANGIAGADAILGSQPGNYSFSAMAGGQRVTFSGVARAQPAIRSGGVANAASFDTSSPVAPGSYISLFGTGLSDFTDYPIPAASLPLAIDYVNVSFDVPSAGLSVPGHLTFVSSTQVNLQVPWELQGQASVQAKVTIDYSTGNVVTIALSDYAPAFFETSPGTVAALDSGIRVIDAVNPAGRGQMVQLYANGLGPVTNQPASGDPAPASPLAATTAAPVVTVGGQTAAVSFSGLAPGFAGLYQLNVTIPPGLSAGTQPLTVTIGGKTSKTSGIVVR
jgi:minor extracellular serine protease Vpr